jgi:hypothetical protein
MCVEKPVSDGSEHVEKPMCMNFSSHFRLKSCICLSTDLREHLVRRSFEIFMVKPPK